MFLEIHIIQSFAPSNLNRDDTNAPKDCEFGGVRRARISSQCIKRALRLHPTFAEAMKVQPGIRTRWMNRMLVQALVSAGKDPEQAKVVSEAFATQYCKMDKEHTSVLLYVSKDEIGQIVAQLNARWDEIISSLKDGKSPVVEAIAKELLRSLKGRTSAPDIAMFGRMMAEKPDLNIDAACQVAHAISTHRVNMEMDFYTAADDLATSDETGAGMMGTTGFNSACFYRYARIDWQQLLSNLGGDREIACRAVEGFLRAAVAAVPTGKQNSFAAQNPPSLLLAVAREESQGWSLANAFEKPVTPDREGGLIAPSVRALDAYWAKLTRAYGNHSMQAFLLALDAEDQLDSLKGYQVQSLEDWVNKTIQSLPC
jgi:CRISPR system Cascade subunit CasC